MIFKAKNGAEIIEKINIDENEVIGKFVNLTYLSKKSPTSKVGDELRSAPLDKYAMICYDIISRNEKEVDYI